MRKSDKRKTYPVYEHLEHYVKKTSYADRLKWLGEFLELKDKLKNKRLVRFVSKPILH